MTYQYNLSEKQIKTLGLNQVEGALKYFAIQNGWSCEFEGVYARIEKDGCNYDLEVVAGKNINSYQENYILKNGNCIEY